MSSAESNGVGRGSTGGRRRLFRGRLSRGWRRALTIAVVLALAFAVATARLLVWPTQGMPPRVDAIVMLAGPGDRMPVALRLASERRAQVLVVSRGAHGYGGPCPPRPLGMRLICFDPDPADTRGEAESVGRVAKHYSWRSMVLVVSRTQATRARLLMGRCFSGDVYVATAPLPVLSWPYEIAYGWAALVKAVLKPSC